MMDLDSAIQHCKEQVQEQAKKGCYSCAEEHQQLAEWLKELKAYREERRMKLLIDIPEHIYEHAKETSEDSRDEFEAMRAIAKGLLQENCGDAISRQAVLDAMYELCSTGETLKENPWRDNPHIDAITDAIENLPSVTPQQKVGRWIKQNYGWNWQCSECGFVTPPSAKEIFTFCPKCGCKMEVEE